MFALTFDDGPDPRGTPAVLDALARARARATFFVLGRKALEQPALLRRVVDEGHAVQVHGFDHLRHPRTTRVAVEDDLDAALEAIGGALDLWRVPWGDLAPWTGEIADKRSLKVVGWDVDSHDWRGDSAEAMLEAIAPRLHREAVVLMHDGVGDGALRHDCGETARLVEPLVAAARRAGLEPALLRRDWDVIAGNPDFVAA